MSFVIKYSLFLCIYWVLVFSGKQSQQYPNPFLSLKYDKVVAYDYNGDYGQAIVDAGNVVDSLINQQVELDQSLIKQLNFTLGDTSTYGGATAFCFVPHLGIVYFDQESVVAHVSICFQCNDLRSSIEIPAMRQANKKIKISEEYSYFARGFTEKGKSELNQLCVDLGFDNCLDKQ